MLLYYKHYKPYRHCSVGFRSGFTRGSLGFYLNFARVSLPPAHLFGGFEEFLYFRKCNKSNWSYWSN